MIKSRLCDLIGIKYPIIQAGMGPFSNNNLAVAAANAGVLGLLSTSGVFDKERQPWVYKAFVDTGGADYDDDIATVIEKVLKRTYNLVKDQGGVFGPNVMVSAEVLEYAHVIIDTAIKVREENPDIKKHFKVIYTSAGDPMGWGDKIKGAGFTWIHVVPSVRAALRCKKAGVDVIVASGHEGGFHTSWEPVHSMILLPDVVETVSDKDTLVVGAGGFSDGKTLAAALVMGADGALMGTRFLATQESDFHQIWKEGVVAAGDRATLIARGFVGPARWLKTPRSVEHASNTLKKSPGVFLGTPDDYSTIDKSLIQYEIESIKATFEGDREKAMMAAGEVAQRIKDMPKVDDMVQEIVREAETILRNAPKLLAQPVQASLSQQKRAGGLSRTSTTVIEPLQSRNGSGVEACPNCGAAAAGAASPGQVCTAVNQLDALKNQIEAQTGKEISEDAAPELLQYITNVQTFLVIASGTISCQGASFLAGKAWRPRQRWRVADSVVACRGSFDADSYADRLLHKKRRIKRQAWYRPPLPPHETALPGSSYT